MTNERSIVDIGDDIAGQLNEMFLPGEMGSSMADVLDTLIKAHGVKDPDEVRALRLAVKDALKRLRPALPLRRAS